MLSPYSVGMLQTNDHGDPLEGLLGHSLASCGKTIAEMPANVTSLVSGESQIGDESTNCCGTQGNHTQRSLPLVASRKGYGNNE
ncbi:hypothetical protein TNIN_86011 [Trichonephila inaurata madagascariensis]|uniref:Uncharacterized protein n=1 Tax=Trichonephila inaurata madagascariensis TaxID=2747483 RepID=A0A8X7C399_9ARAC|nr:hypothetical protein TNIN_86011 [Trichonephila inaurata madagascariensis]